MEITKGGMLISKETKELIVEFNNAFHDLLVYANAKKLLRAKYRDHLWEIHKKLILVFEPESWEAEAIRWGADREGKPNDPRA